MERILIVNRAQCLECGDVLISKYRHDYVTCSCGNLSVDGGLDYLKRNTMNFETFKEMSLYTDSNWTEIRSNVFRGSRGKYGDQPLKWIALPDIDNEYLVDLIKFKEDIGQTKDIHYWAYKKEQEYRE